MWREESSYIWETISLSFCYPRIVWLGHFLGITISFVLRRSCSPHVIIQKRGPALPRASPVILWGLTLPSGCHWHYVQMQLQLLGPRAVSSPAAGLLWAPELGLQADPGWWCQDSQQLRVCSLQLDAGTWVFAAVQLMAAEKIKREKSAFDLWIQSSGYERHG